MPKKITKPKKESKKINSFDKIIDNLIVKIGDIKPIYITFIGGIIFLLGIIFQHGLINNFLGPETSSFLFVNLENSLLFALLFLGVFLVGALAPPFFIFAILGALITNNIEHQVYIMFGLVIIGILFFYFKWYRNFFSKYLNTILIIYGILFIVGSFIYYSTGVINRTTSVEITTSSETFQAKLSFSNGDYYFIEKDGEKIILNSRDVKSIKILQTGKYNINICNNTDTIFDEVSLYYGLNYSKLEPGECSEYKERKELYKLIPMTIFTTDNGVDIRYTMFPTDYVGEELYSNGNYTIHINQLLKENQTIEYNGGIEFEIK